MAYLITKKEKDKKLEQIILLAPLLHKKWQSLRQKNDGQCTPMIEKTKDKVWIKLHRTSYLDIANTKYKDLPQDWRLENEKSAGVALTEVYKAKNNNEQLNKDFIEKASAILHKKWLMRNKRIASILQKEIYKELPESEKDLDRAVIRLCLKIVNKKNNKK